MVSLLSEPPRKPRHAASPLNAVEILRTLLGGITERKILNQFPGGSMVKNPPAKAGDAGDAGSILSKEDSLEKGMATHSSILT